jgi:hypothetical protein
VRETLKGQEFSFTEIAKVVGERWQVLPADEREACERQANSAKEKYYAQLTEYKKTPQYEAYQKYLEDFKAKHAAPQKGKFPLPPSTISRKRVTVVTGIEGKRSKLETETTTSTRSSSHEQADRSSGRRISSTQSDPFAAGHFHSESSPPVGPARLPSAPLYSTKSTSPATHPISVLNSPRMGEQYSPLSASPRSATLHKENSYDFQPSNLGRDPRVPSDINLPYPATAAYGQPYQPASTTPPSAGYPSYHTAPIDLPSRRSFREPTRLPPLTSEDTTLSSESGGASSSASYPSAFIPPIDSQKPMRTLPQPIPNIGPHPTPLDRPLPSVSSPQQTQQQPEYRTSSSLAALLRAGELARVADDEANENESSG